MRGFSLIVLLFTVLLANQSSGMAADWRMVKNSDNIKIHVQTIKGSGYEAFKGVTRIRTSFKNLLVIMADTRNHCKWMHECGGSNVLKQVSFTERYIYQINYLPFPLSNRDVIMHSTASANKRGDVVTIHLKAAPDFCDNEKNLRTCHKLGRRKAGKEFIRIKKAQGFFRLRKLSDRLVEVTWQMHAEPGGDISGWMANFNLVDIPFNTLQGLKSYVKRRNS